MDLKNVIYTMDFYSAIKKNGIMLFKGKWMEIEIMLSKVSQTEKNQSSTLICRS
jgi:hypothetical protein